MVASPRSSPLIGCRAEEELHQTRGFERLLPGRRHAAWLSHVPTCGYSDQLAAAWEERHGDTRARGRELLTRLCSQGRHLDKDGETEP